MSSDSAFSNLDSQNQPEDAESNSAIPGHPSFEPVLPEVELDPVLLYLKSISAGTLVEDDSTTEELETQEAMALVEIVTSEPESSDAIADVENQRSEPESSDAIVNVENVTSLPSPTSLEETNLDDAGVEIVSDVNSESANFAVFDTKFDVEVFEEKQLTELVSQEPLPKFSVEVTQTESTSTTDEVLSTETTSTIIKDEESQPTPVEAEPTTSPVISDTEKSPEISDKVENSISTDFEELVSNAQVVAPTVQVQIKSEGSRLLVILPTEAAAPASEHSWSEIRHSTKLRLFAGERFWQPNSQVHLIARDRLLDGRQLQEISEDLQKAQLQLISVATSRRQTAIAAVSAGYSVEQIQPQATLTEPKPTPSPLADSLYLEMTVRSGVEIRHPGTVIILGDVNPGGIAIADGDILVWGRLRGIAHAGASGNRECLIMALQMEPTQLRIADAVARAPEKSPVQFYPEVAYVTPQGIRIARANDFSRSLVTKINQES